MKRFLACLFFLLAVLAVSAGYSSGVDKSTQETTNHYTTVGFADCGDLSENTSHSVAYAENGTFTQLVTGTNYSPRSSFPTLTITRNIPSPSYEGHDANIRRHIVIGRISPVHARLYVLRV